MLYRNRMSRDDVPITQRDGLASDAPIIARMARDYIENGLRWTWRKRRVQQVLRAPDTVVRVAETAPGTEIAGFAIMRFGVERAHLSLLAVHPSYRRRRIAQSLLRWLEDSARSAGLREVRLEVRTGNTTALGFYRRLGYRAVSRLPDYYGGRESAFLMARELGIPGAGPPHAARIAAATG